MTILTVLGWILLSLLILFMLLLCAVILPPVSYHVRGRWHEGFSFAARFGSKLFSVQFSRSAAGEMCFRLRLFGFVLFDKPLTGKKEQRVKYKKKEKKNAKKISSGDVLPLFDRKFIGRMVKMAGKLLRDTSPRVFEVSGTLGFDDPYYTGILAVFRTLVPGLAVEPDFTGENHDVRFRLAGRILPVIVLWEGLKLVFSREAWTVLKKIIKNKKARKKCNQVQTAGV